MSMTTQWKKFPSFFEALTSVSESFKLLLIAGVWGGLIVLEFVLGLVTVNIHFITDGFQSSLHVVSYTFSLFSLTFSKQTANPGFTYGFTRFETLSAFSNSVFLLFVCFLNIFQHFHHIIEEFEDEEEPNGELEGGAAQKGILAYKGPILKYFEGESSLIIFHVLRLVISLCVMCAFAEYARMFDAKEVDSKSHQLYMGWQHKPKVMKLASMFVWPSLIETDPLDHPSNYYRNIGISSHWENLHSVFLHAWIDAMLDIMAIVNFSFKGVPKFYIVEIGLATLACCIAVKLTKPLIISTGMVLLQGCPYYSAYELDKILRDVSFVEGVTEISEKKFWGLNTNYLIANLKVKIINQGYYDSAMKEIKEVLGPKFQSVTVELFWN